MYKHIALNAGLLLVAVSSWAQSPPAAPAAPVVASTNQGGPAPTSLAEMEAYIRSQSVGGELDFTKILASKKQTTFLYGGQMLDKKELAMYMWGAKVKELGVATAQQAQVLYEDIIKKRLTESEKKSLESSFEVTAE
ncbi:hypothetical protein [Hymenobacter koreensis]